VSTGKLRFGLTIYGCAAYVVWPLVSLVGDILPGPVWRNSFTTVYLLLPAISLFAAAALGLRKGRPWQRIAPCVLTILLVALFIYFIIWMNMQPNPFSSSSLGQR